MAEDLCDDYDLVFLCTKVYSSVERSIVRLQNVSRSIRSAGQTEAIGGSFNGLVTRSVDRFLMKLFFFDFGGYWGSFSVVLQQILVICGEKSILVCFAEFYIVADMVIGGGDVGETSLCMTGT